LVKLEEKVSAADNETGAEMPLFSNEVGTGRPKDERHIRIRGVMGILCPVVMTLMFGRMM